MGRGGEMDQHALRPNHHPNKLPCMSQVWFRVVREWPGRILVEVGTNLNA